MKIYDTGTIDRRKEVLRKMTADDLRHGGFEVFVARLQLAMESGDEEELERLSDDCMEAEIWDAQFTVGALFMQLATNKLLIDGAFDARG